MKTSSKKTDVKEDLGKETKEGHEEELPVEETEAAEELEETEERAEEEVTEEEVSEEVEEEEKPERIEKEEAEEIVEERIYTIPLGRAWISAPKKRAPRAIRLVKSFIIRHMKIKTDATEEEEAERLVIRNEVNEKIWGSGIKNPPRKIRIRAVKDKEGTVTLHLAEGD